MSKMKLLLFSFVSLILGSSIYLFLRVSSLKIFSLINILDVDFSNSAIRQYALKHSNIFPDWFLFSLPDGLWTFSYVTMMSYLWNLEINYQSSFWIGLVPTTAVLSEVGQMLGIVSGTFDFQDLLFYILGTFLPLLFINKKNKIQTS